MRAEPVPRGNRRCGPSASPAIDKPDVFELTMEPARRTASTRSRRERFASALLDDRFDDPVGLRDPFEIRIESPGPDAAGDVGREKRIGFERARALEPLARRLRGHIEQRDRVSGVCEDVRRSARPLCRRPARSRIVFLVKRTACFAMLHSRRIPLSIWRSLHVTTGHACRWQHVVWSFNCRGRADARHDGRSWRDDRRSVVRRAPRRDRDGAERRHEPGSQRDDRRARAFSDSGAAAGHV